MTAPILKTRDEEQLRYIASGRPLDPGTASAVLQRLRTNPTESVVWGYSLAELRPVLAGRLERLRRYGPGLFSWWRRRFNQEPPIESLWYVYLPLSEWIVEQKRRTAGKRLFIFGISGSIGRGKSTLSEAVGQLVNAQLSREEGVAVSRSLDDFYLPHAARRKPAFLARGYRPQGISNRGPAGTHDVALLQRTIHAMENNLPGGRLALPSFDKQRDDRAPDGTIVRGRVGVFLLDGWFLGCSTDFDASHIPFGLKRSVAQALPSYRPVFDRLDALWAFDRPSLRDIIDNRIRQQRTLDRQSGRMGMTPAQVERFVRYFYEDAWQRGVTSPHPVPSRVSFWARLDSVYQIVDLRRGARPERP